MEQLFDGVLEMFSYMMFFFRLRSMSQEYSDTLTRLLDQLEDSERWQTDVSFSCMLSLCKEYLD